MRWLLDFLMGGPKPLPWKLVGIHQNKLIETNPHTETKKTYPFSVLLYMTDDGRRKVELRAHNAQGEEYVKTRDDEYHNAVIWAEGGEFPKDFKYIKDTLSPMLVRLVDMEMGIEE